LNKIHPLKDGFALLKEKDNNYFISLVFLDLSQRSLQKIHTVKCPYDYIKIFINEADPTTFILSYDIDFEQFVQICKIVGKQIIFGNMIDTDFSPDYFYGNYAYFSKWFDERGRDLDVRISYISN
jgi:hypothetical protein